MNKYPIFYSYIFFVMVTDGVSYAIYLLYPHYYASVFWFCFIAWLVAEFAVLAEASDHIFKPYPPIRRLGRLLTVCICVIFFVVYVAPPLLQPQSSRAAMLELVKRSSLTKAVLILVLLGAARLYRLPLGKNVSGLMLGFATYLAFNIANMALDQKYGGAGYAGIFAIVGPVSFVVALAIWNVALWRFDPALSRGREFERGAENISEPLANRLGKYDSELTRLFRR
ncbi:MAG TPA: hypothetical protein VGV68_16615 [Terriglobia bacterium]|nr:hypothetical protein [Terriglobia bacterium]